MRIDESLYEGPWQVVPKKVYERILRQNSFFQTIPTPHLLPDFEGGLYQGKVILNRKVPTWDTKLQEALALADQE